MVLWVATLIIGMIFGTIFGWILLRLTLGYAASRGNARRRAIHQDRATWQDIRNIITLADREERMTRTEACFVVINPAEGCAIVFSWEEKERLARHNWTRWHLCSNLNDACNRLRREMRYACSHRLPGHYAYWGVVSAAGLRHSIVFSKDEADRLVEADPTTESRRYDTFKQALIRLRSQTEENAYHCTVFIGVVGGNSNRQKVCHSWMDLRREIFGCGMRAKFQDFDNWWAARDWANAEQRRFDRWVDD